MGKEQLDGNFHEIISQSEAVPRPIAMTKEECLAFLTEVLGIPDKIIKELKKSQLELSENRIKKIMGKIKEAANRKWESLTLEQQKRVWFILLGNRPFPRSLNHPQEV